MHLMESFTVLQQTSDLELHRRKLAELIGIITTHMIDPETGCGRNQFDRAFHPLPAIAIGRTWNAEREGEEPEAPTDTTSYGHNVELAWLLRRAIDVAGMEPQTHRATLKRLLDHAVRDGLDRDWGGIYRDGTGRGGPPGAGEGVLAARRGPGGIPRWL